MSYKESIELSSGVKNYFHSEGLIRSSSSSEFSKSGTSFSDTSFISWKLFVGIIEAGGKDSNFHAD